MPLNERSAGANPPQTEKEKPGLYKDFPCVIGGLQGIEKCQPNCHLMGREGNCLLKALVVKTNHLLRMLSSEDINKHEECAATSKTKGEKQDGNKPTVGNEVSDK